MLICFTVLEISMDKCSMSGRNKTLHKVVSPPLVGSQTESVKRSARALERKSVFYALLSVCVDLAHTARINTSVVLA